MKRIIALLLCIITVSISFAACGKDSNNGDVSGNAAASIPDGKESDDPADVLAFRSDRYEVNNDMLNYFFRMDYYDNIDAYYGSYYQYYELNPTLDLKGQACKMYQDGSDWFNYFMALTCANIRRYLYFAEAALDQNTVDEAEVAANVEKDIAAIKDSAEEYYHITFDDFITTRFGETVSEDEIRAALKLYYTATLHYDKVVASIVPTEADITDYYNEHKSDFLYCDYRSYSINANYPTGATEAQKAEENKRVAALADSLCATGNKEAYSKWILDYEKQINPTREEPYSEEKMEYIANRVVGEYAYNDKAAFGQWAFAEGRKAGDMTVLDNGQGVYTVYYIETAPYRREYNTVDFRRILVDVEAYENDMTKAKAAADELLAKWEATDRSEESFEALAQEEAPGRKNLIEGAARGDMESYIGAWCYDESRKYGDYSLVESEYGYYLVFYCGENQPKWRLDAIDKFTSEKLNAEFADYQEKYNVLMNENNVNLITGITAYTEK